MRNYIAAIIKHRKWVLGLTVLVTLGLIYQLKSLNIVIDPDTTLPQSHPIIVTGNTIEKTFGNKFNVVIGITANVLFVYTAMNVLGIDYVQVADVDNSLGILVSTNFWRNNAPANMNTQMGPPSP